MLARDGASLQASPPCRSWTLTRPTARRTLTDMEPKPPRCAWCERPIEQPHDVCALSGVTYHAACLDATETILSVDVEL